jgi:hypothetical protein
MLGDSLGSIHDVMTWDRSKPTLWILEGPAFARNWTPEVFQLHVRAAVIYENMADFAAAEEIYEFLLKQDCFGEVSTVTSNFVRLNKLFRKRVADMDTWGDESTRSFQGSLPYLYTCHRVSALDSDLLNKALLNSSAFPQTWLLFASTAGS